MMRQWWIESVLVMVFCLGQQPNVSAQTQRPLPEFGFDLNFNHTDVMMGGHAGVSFSKINASLKGTFKGRLGSKRIVVETEDPNILIQYRERRYLLGIEADKRFLLTQFNESTNFGAFVGGFGGLSFGDYRGTKAAAPVGLAGSLMGGIYISDPDAVVIRMGYQYLPMQTQNVFNHRIVISFSLLIS